MVESNDAFIRFFNEIKKFQPFNEQEATDQQLLLRYLEVFDDMFSRQNTLIHMTSSPWIVNNDKTKVLMIYHNIYQSWGWCGGDCDGEMDCAYVAKKEGMEETGVKHLKLLTPSIYAIDILPVQGHVKNNSYVSSHLHVNLTYLYEADEFEELCMKPDENAGVRWISLNDISSYVTEKNMLPVYQKLIDKLSQ